MYNAQEMWRRLDPWEISTGFAKNSASSVTFALATAVIPFAKISAKGYLDIEFWLQISPFFGST